MMPRRAVEAVLRALDLTYSCPTTHNSRTSQYRRYINSLEPLGRCNTSARYFSAMKHLAPDQNSNSSSSSSNNSSDTDVHLSYVAYENKKDTSSQSSVLFHHRFLGRKEHWSQVGKELAHLTGRKIVIPDARNHGNSPSSYLMTHKEMSGDLTRLLTQLDLKQTSLVGQGLGGRVAMYTALTRPDLVDKLVVISSSPINTEQGLKEWEVLNQACYVVNTLVGAEKHHGNYKEVLNSLEFKLEADKALKQLMPESRIRALFLTNFGNADRSAIMSMPNLGKFPNMDQYCHTKPVLFLRGPEEAPWKSVDDEIRKIRQIFPNSHFAQLNGSAPFVKVDHQEEFLEAIINFL